MLGAPDTSVPPRGHASAPHRTLEQAGDRHQPLHHLCLLLGRRHHAARAAQHKRPRGAQLAQGHQGLGAGCLQVRRQACSGVRPEGGRRMEDTSG